MLLPDPVRLAVSPLMALNDGWRPCNSSPAYFSDGEGKGLVGNFGSVAMTRIASCQCRGFRVVVEAEPDTIAVCHCQICQRRTGVPLTCNAYFPKSKVRLEGEHRIYTRDCSGGTQTAQPLLPRLRLDGRLDPRSTSKSVWRCGWVLQRPEFSAPGGVDLGGRDVRLDNTASGHSAFPASSDQFRARAKRFPTPTRWSSSAAS